MGLLAQKLNQESRPTGLNPMLASRPSFATCRTNSLPTGLKVCNFKNRRINFNDLFQSNEYGIRHRNFGGSNALPAMGVSVVRNQQYWF
jgi:hypothetical protein